MLASILVFEILHTRISDLTKNYKVRWDPSRHNFAFAARMLSLIDIAEECS